MINHQYQNQSKTNMSEDPNKGARIFFSVLFRVVFLGWPGIAGVAIGAIDLHNTLLLEPYYGSRYYYPSIKGAEIYCVVLYALVVAYTLFVMGILPMLKNKMIPVVLFIIDFLLFATNIGYIVYLAYYGYIYGLGFRLAISGTVIGLWIIIVSLFGSIIPFFKEKGFSGLFTPQRYYYGCLFAELPITATSEAYPPNRGTVQYHLEESPYKHEPDKVGP